MKAALAKSRADAVDGFARPERCFSRNESFRECDQVALILTETGWLNLLSRLASSAANANLLLD